LERLVVAGRVYNAIKVMKDFPFEYALFLKFEAREGEVLVKDFAFPLQRVTRTSFEVLDPRPVAAGYEGVLHKHLSCREFSIRDLPLLRSFPLNLLVVRDRVVRVAWRGELYAAHEEGAGDGVGEGALEEGEVRYKVRAIPNPRLCGGGRLVEGLLGRGHRR